MKYRTIKQFSKKRVPEDNENNALFLCIKMIAIMVIGDDQRCQLNARRNEFKIVNHFIVVICYVPGKEGSSAEERGGAY